MNLLLVDDHPLTLVAYTKIISEGFTDGKPVHLKAVANCAQAYAAINESDAFFDCAIIDYSLPAYGEGQLYTGVDIGRLLRKMQPACHILL